MALERKPTPRSSQISFSETEWISPVLATREGYPEFDIYSQPDWKQIRVGYIDPVRGYVTNADLCQANAHAKLNPGTQFIIQNRESVRYMNINEVNSLVDSTYSIDVEEGDHCSINWAQDDPKTPIVYFSGGGGVGAAANPIVGNESKSVIALHLVEGGFGYKYPPKVTVMSKTGVGGGVVAEAFLGEFHTGTEVYGEQSDIESYYPSDNQVNPVTGKKFPHNLSQECTATLNNVGFGSVWDAKGNPVRNWEPSFYNQTWENPFQREILDYQEYLRNALKPWFVSKRVHLSLNRVVGIEQQLKGEFIPTVVCSGIDKNDDYYYSRLKTFAGTTTKVYDVVKSEWGRYEKGDVTEEGKYDSSSTNAGVREVEFKVFAHVATAALNQGIPGGLRFEFREVKDSTLLANPLQVGDMGEQSYGPDRFSVSIDDIKEDSLSGDIIETKQAKTVFKNVKPGVLYHVISQGKWKGKSTEQGLINKLGIKPSERQLDSNNPRSDQTKVGQAIFADLIGSANDNDDLQIQAEIGEFTQVRKRWTEDGVKFNQPKSELKLKTFTNEHSSNYGESTGEWEEVFIEPKGSTTYDLFYKVGNREIDDFNSKKDKSSPKNKGKEPDDTSFMNKYAISPVPASDDKGSDYANQMFTIEWEQSFDITGDYTFRAQAAGECYFYMDGVPINIHPNRTSPHRINSYTRAPSKWKEFIPTSTIKRIRCDITNTPKLEDVIIQSEGDGDEYVPDGSQFQDIEFDVFSHVAPQWSGWDKIDVSAPNEVTFTSVDSAAFTNKFHLVEITQQAGFLVEYKGLHSANTPASMKPRTSDDAKYAGSVDNFICLKDGDGPDCNGQLVINNWQDGKFGADGRSIIPHGENYKKNGYVDLEIRYYGSDGSRGGKHMKSLTIGGKTWNINNEGGGGPVQTVRLSGTGDVVVSKEIMSLTRTETKTVELKSGADYGCFFTSSGNTSNVTAHIGINSKDDIIKAAPGKTIGMNDQGFTTGSGPGGIHSPRNMVVGCNKGRFRSADGTDDSGDFGHTPLPSNFKQIYWSMPKQAPSKPIDGSNGLKFTFNAVDGTHSFQVKSKDIHPAITYQKAALKKMLKKVKINTKYIVQATQLGKKETIEQGLMDKMGRDPKEINFSKNLMPSKRGQFIFADVRGSDHDKDDIQIGTTKGYFTALNRRQVKFSDETKKEGNKIIRVEKAYSTYDLEFYYEVKTEPTAVTPSGDVKFKTENIFNTVTNIKGASRDLYRTNAYGRGGFLNDSGVCPFPVIEDLQNSTLNDNPYAGEHKIVWNNIKFPVDADYNIKVAVDDAAVLKLEGPNGVTTINKEGFVNGKSTGSTIFRQYLKKGSYKLTALLIQKAGGRFGFKALTQAERQQRQQNILDTIKPAPLPPPKKTSMVTFTTSSEAGYTNSCTIAGIAVLTRNATITKEVEVGKEYTVSFTSTGYGGSNERVQIKMADGGRKIKMEDSKDADFNDLVLTINGGRFDNIRDNRFVTYIGGLTDGDAAAQPKVEKPFPQSIDDIELKGINPMAIAIDIKVKYGTGKKVKAQSWNDNPFAVALSIEAPIKSPPQDDIPKAPGRCPDNPFWTTRHPLDHSLATETWFPVYLPPGRDGDRWHEFMNKYAMSPIPPMDDKGTDFGGKWYKQTWHKMIDSPGWYTFRAMADDNLRFFIGTLSGTEEISFFKRDKDNAPWGSLQEPIEKSIELSAGPTSFEVWVKNLSTTKYDIIKKKVFSARDWVGKGLNEDDFGGEKYNKHQFRDITFDVFAHVAKKFSFYGKEPERKVIDVTFTSTDSADYENKFHVVEITQGEGFLVEYKGLHSANTPASMKPRTSDDAKYAGSVDNFICLKDGLGDDCNGQLVINNWQDAKFGADGRSIIPHGENYKKNGFVDVEIRYYGSDGSGHGKHMKSLTIGGKTWNINNEGSGSAVKTVRLTGSGDLVVSKEIMSLTRTESKTVELKSGVDYGCFFTSSGNQGNVTAHIGMNSVDDSIKTSSTGKTIGMNDQGFSTGGRHSPRNMVVECSKGRIRSADGTDDTGDFGHLAQPSNFKQILWSMPKQAPSKPIDGTNGLKFAFNAVDGSHSFEIKSKDIHPAITYTKATLKKMTKKVKINTKYIVQATQLGKKSNIEQGLIEKMGRKPKEIDYNPNLLPSKRGQHIFADVVASGDDTDDIQVGTSKGYFTSSNKRFIDGRGDTYDLEFYYKVKTKSNEVTPSGDVTFKTENIFNTVADIKNANRDLYRINVYDKGGFINDAGVCPFPVAEDLQNSTVNDNPYAGEHKIVWNNIKFPVDADYNIKVAVDDAAVLKLEGPNGVTTINKNGFVNGKSTGSTIFRQYLKKGSYKLTVTLIQKAGGRFGFKTLTQAERKQRKKNIFDSIKPAPLPPPKKTSMVTFKTTSEAGYTNSCTIAGLVKLTRNATSTHEVEVGKEYNVSFASSGYGGTNSKIRIKMADGGRKIKMEDSKDADFNDLVLTINGGKFTNIRDNRFVTYVGGLTDGDAALEPPPSTGPQSADDIELKGINPMAVAIDIKVKYGTGKKVKSQSWNENPFGLALSIEAPIKAPPQDEIPLAEGRCPRNPFWTTRFPIDKQTATETWFPVYLPPGKEGDRWHEFMNKYAMSPIPPMDDKGTDFGGRWYKQTWSEIIDSPGWYTFKAMADDNLRFFIGTLRGNEEITFFKKDKNNAPWGSLQEPLQKSVKLNAGPTTFEVWVKNMSTTKYDTIKKKVFSARDWVGKGLDEGDFEGGKYDKHKLRNITFDVFTHVAKRFSFYGKEPQKKAIDVTFTCTHGADYHNKFFLVELSTQEGFLVEYKGLHSANTPASMKPRTSDDAKYAGSVDNFICLKDGLGDDCNGQLVINNWQDAKFGADGRSIIPHGENYKKNGFVDVEIRYHGSDGSGHGKHMKSLTIAGKTWNINNEGSGSAVKTVRLSGKGDVIAKEVLALTGAGPKVGAETKTVELKSGVDYGAYFTSSGNSSNVTAEMTDNGKTIGIDDLGRGGSKARTNMVVKCSHGKFRSRDGTDDTGVFGHTPLSSNFRQVLWQVPKSESGLGVAYDRPEDELKFTFVEKGGKHKFTISGNELKNTSTNKGLFLSNTNSSLKKKIKMNTKYKVTGSFMKKSELVEQGLIKKLGRTPEEKDYNPNLLPSIRGSYIFADVAESADENDDLQIGCTEGYFTASNKRKHTRKGRGDTYDLEYFVEWTPPAVTVNEYIKSGTTKNGVTYEGPYLFKYIESGWSSYMNKFAVSPLDDPKQSLNSPDDRILGTKTLTWKNVNFELDGSYNYKFIGDDKAKLYVGGKYIKETSNSFKSKNPAEKTFRIDKAGRYDITVELTNTGTNGLWFDNPSGMVLEITTDIQKVRYDSDGVVDSKSWAENPVGVSMECIPPPCAKERSGGGVVDDLLIIDPGPGDLVPPPEPGTPEYPVTPKITSLVIVKPGINYNPNEKLRIGIGSNPPIWRDLELDNFGGITSIRPATPGDPTEYLPDDGDPDIPTDDWPDIRIDIPPPPGGGPGDPGDFEDPGDIPPPGRPPDTGIGSTLPPLRIPTGTGAVIIPKIEVVPLLPPNIDPRTGLVVPENQIIQVTDLVGLKQTGWYDGRAYYGAVFYKNGVKYAGYYETAGALIQVYDSKQESIDAEVTTLPSAILRQGTDVTAADPRLNIPGTPQ